VLAFVSSIDLEYAFSRVTGGSTESSLRLGWRRASPAAFEARRGDWRYPTRGGVLPPPARGDLAAFPDLRGDRTAARRLWWRGGLGDLTWSAGRVASEGIVTWGGLGLCIRAGPAAPGPRPL